MLIFRTVFVASLLVITTSAHATSIITTTNTLVNAIGSTSNGATKLSSSSSDNKIVLAGRDDAASFVASEGAIRGAMLEQALDHMRHVNPEFRGSTDAQLAQAILMM